MQFHNVTKEKPEKFLRMILKILQRTQKPQLSLSGSLQGREMLRLAFLKLFEGFHRTKPNWKPRLDLAFWSYVGDEQWIRYVLYLF